MFSGFDEPDFDFEPDSMSWQEPDIVLSYLVSSIVNLANAPLGVTLLVKGTMITGTLISERDYLATLTNMLQTQIRRSLTGLDAEERRMAELAFDLRDLTEDYYPDIGDDDNDDDDDAETMPPPHIINHIHLKEPVIVSPQPALGFAEGVFPVMRIRLLSIDGWMLGTSMPGFEDLPDDGGIRH
jgi:hypothetical protein